MADERTEAAAVALKVQPLKCPNCNGPVPLGEADTVSCPFCGQSVAIPPEHIALRKAEGQRANLEAELTELYAGIGKPPGLLLRAWGSAIGQLVITIGKVLSVLFLVWVFLIGVVWHARKSIDDLKTLGAVLMLPFGALFLVVWLLARGLHSLAPLFGFDFIDLYSFAGTLFVLGVAAYVVVSLPLALFRFAESFAKVRQRLQACLAAKPPRAQGGPSECRQCGAALSVTAGALGARCLYCKADNLLALPASWVAHVIDQTKTFHLHVESAVEEEHSCRSEASSHSRTILFGSLALPIVLGGLGWLFQAAHLVEYHANWQTTVAATRDFTPHPCTLLDGNCDGNRSDLFDVALRRGETLVLGFDSDPSGVEVRRLEGGGKSVDWIAPVGMESGYHARFLAPNSGWFVVEGMTGHGLYRVTDWKIRVEPPK